MIDFGIFMVGIITPIVILRYMRKLEDEKKEREKVFEKWIFESLYSINQKVLLPTEHERPMLSKRAVVFKPTEDPMAEFQGLKDDNI